MAVVKTKHFGSAYQRPRVPPDGTSLEEQMNVFLATLPFSNVMDVQVSAVHGKSALLHYIGLVIYQG